MLIVMQHQHPKQQIIIFARTNAKRLWPGLAYVENATRNKHIYWMLALNTVHSCPSFKSLISTFSSIFQVLVDQMIIINGKPFLFQELNLGKNSHQLLQRD